MASEKQSRPGLVDLQVNGFAGIDFNSELLTPDDVCSVCRQLRRESVVAFLPTLITNTPDVLEKLIKTIINTPAEEGAEILGIHLEGPFISPMPGARGAHPEEWIREPCLDEVRKYQDLAQGKIRLITLSPEWPDSHRFIERLCEMGIRVAIGHTLATSEQIREAVQAGATLATHLGNGIPAQLARHPNPIWSQLAEDRLWISAIGDGFHLPQEVFAVFEKVKKEKMLLVSDSTQFAGMTPGRYCSHIGGDVVLSQDGKLAMADEPQLLAGSAMSLRKMIDRLAENGWLSFETAWEMGSMRPWQFLGETRPLEMVHATVFR